jgi:CRISPR system Cascade subunit CasD
MKSYLIFRLHGALASWGDIAVGDIRPSYRYPAKSAVIGLLAAALGIKRDDADKLNELFKLQFSIRVDAFGVPIEDYQTIQTPSEQAIKNDRGKDYWTRLDEIAAINWRVIQSQNNAEAGAIQSRRTYYCDALYTIALSENANNSLAWNKLNPEVTQLNGLLQFLEKPLFNLYLGRKSCPLSLPLEAQIKEGENCQQAIEVAEFNFQEELALLTKSVETIAYYSEENLPDSQMKLSRRDQPVNKSTWQFTDRDEYYVSIKRGHDVSA